VAEFAAHKVVSSLPGVLAANTLYLVRVGTGFRPYVTNSSGTIVAYPLDPPAWSELTGKPAFGNASLAGAAPLQCGRLTLQSGVPVTTADVTGQSTIYFTPWRGNVFSIFDGSDWVPYAFAELSRSISGLTSGKNYDVFGYVSGGSPVIDLAPAWTSDTGRSAALSLLNGVYVNTSSFTPVMAGGTVAANRGTLLGTIRTTGTNTTEDSYTRRFVASLHHPVAKLLYRADGTSHTYSSNTIRGWNNASTHTVEWVSPVPMHGVILNFSAGMFPSAAGSFTARVGLANVTTAQFASVDFYTGAPVSAGAALPTDPGNGYRVYYVTEAATGTNNTTFYSYVVHGLVMV